MSYSISEKILLFIFWLQLQKSGSKERELKRPSQETNVSEKGKLDQRADQAKSNQEAILVIQDYGKIIESKKKDILNVAFKHERIFKRFKVLEIFREMIKEFGGSRSTAFYIKPFRDA